MCLTAPPEFCKCLAPNAAKIANHSSMKTTHGIIDGQVKNAETETEVQKWKYRNGNMEVRT